MQQVKWFRVTERLVVHCTQNMASGRKSCLLHTTIRQAPNVWVVCGSSPAPEQTIIILV